MNLKIVLELVDELHHYNKIEKKLMYNIRTYRHRVKTNQDCLNDALKRRQELLQKITELTKSLRLELNSK